LQPGHRPQTGFLLTRPFINNNINGIEPTLKSNVEMAIQKPSATNQLTCSRYRYPNPLVICVCKVWWSYIRPLPTRQSEVFADNLIGTNILIMYESC
jgi:hypothetical protein